MYHNKRQKVFKNPVEIRYMEKIENVEAVWNISETMSDTIHINQPDYLIQRIDEANTIDNEDVFFLSYNNNEERYPTDGCLRNGRKVYYYHSPTVLADLVKDMKRGCLLLKRDKTIWRLLNINFEAGGGRARGKLQRFELHKNVNVNKLIINRGGDDELKRLASELKEEELVFAAKYSPIAKVEYDRRKAEWQQSKKAERDVVTDLLSRENLDAYLREISERQNAFPVCILFLDIDKFKQVNDDKGHDIGDLALRVVAAQVTAFAYPGGKAFRYGGEEIVAILEKCELSKAEKIAEHIRAAVEASRIPINADFFNITVSIGVSIATKSNDLEKAIKRADKAMYKAKEAGRNRVVIEN
jgi:diguanylate cyclase (GGDEF)-like protein